MGNGEVDLTHGEAMAADAGKADAVRSVARALMLLRLMNTTHESSLHDLHAATGLPKATIFRLLRTLRLEGYVQVVGDGGHYRLTSKVTELGAGYTEKSRVVDAGIPIALALTKKIRWPLAIGVLDGDAVVVRYSTMPYSPLAVHATTLGQRLGLLDTAMGRVYLAHCGDAERSALLQLLRDASPDGRIEQERLLDSELELIRRKGYAIRKPNARRSSATIAVPIMADAMLGTLCLTTFGKSLTSDMISEYAPILFKAASTIAARRHQEPTQA